MQSQTGHGAAISSLASGSSIAALDGRLAASPNARVPCVEIASSSSSMDEITIRKSSSPMRSSFAPRPPADLAACKDYSSHIRIAVLGDGTPRFLL
ncbi:hypothetical protein DI09_27p220 [Mitosporidium daphniae]|uniref:Uncharacterized protein n=1 Tax=Mitosporidium daphniae TaxID=1485682 RepID=A0A098VRV7_9MICR|nr:uncharacterized protein DI09_27p220 [Mitosporidium daphniae]KGG51783.1 hypothetical protein DI09_27p220 [Mitosporidium daphniae]|eukprot:XP_013238210.1 uncharacterized protein DI09_27p220 [Mitosporidium daphniae]